MTDLKSNIIANLDSFTTQYLQTALWSSTDPDTEVPLDRDYDISDFSLTTLAQAIEDCKIFQENYSELWEDDNDDSTAGHDFWLTRNGHGAGFWDGDYVNGNALTDASKAYGSIDLMPYDGEVHGN